MRIALILFLLFSLASHATGVTFSLETKAPPLSGDRRPCAVLSCEEDNASSASSLDQGHVTVSSSSSPITDMKIFMTPPNTDSNERSLLASVTSQEPNISRMSNGMKVDAQMGTSRARMHLELFKSKDCSAEFTCEVSSIDSRGIKIINSNRIKQLQTTRAYQSRDRMLSSHGSSQIMMLVQQLALLENRLEDRMRSIEDKIENRVADKLCQLEAKCSLQVDRAKLVSENKLENYGKDIFEQLEKALGVSELVKKNLNNSLDVLERHEKQLQHLNKTCDVGVSKLEHTKLQLVESSGLASNACNRSTELFYSIYDQISLTNSMMNSTFQPIADLLMPKHCKKGLISLVAQTPFPHPVIRPNQGSVLNVSYLCDEITDGGGWIVFQRRATGDEEFYRDWATYKRGFGSLTGDFWLGNENLHALTSSGTYELRIDLKYNGKSAFAQYSSFSVASEKDNYAVTFEAYHGTAGDSLARHNGMAFSTFDRDNDIHRSEFCARAYIGAWWYKDCHDNNLNGKWGASNHQGPRWKVFTDRGPATFTEMKIRLQD